MQEKKGAMLSRRCEGSMCGCFGLVAFKILDRTFVFLGGGAGTERTEVAAFAGFRILPSRIEPVFARCKFSYHEAK
jgi:hypothetical protein